MRCWRSSWRTSSTRAPRAQRICRRSGAFYPVRQAVLAAFALAAVRVKDRRFHAAFLVLALAIEVWWILGQFYILG